MSVSCSYRYGCVAMPIREVILKAQAAVQYSVGGAGTLQTSEVWLWRWKVQHGIC